MQPARINPKTHPGAGTGVDLISCACKDSFQDARYGTGIRVMNRADGHWNCTVCGAKPTAEKALKAS